MFTQPEAATGVRKETMVKETMVTHYGCSTLCGSGKYPNHSHKGVETKMTLAFTLKQLGTLHSANNSYCRL